MPACPRLDRASPFNDSARTVVVTPLPDTDDDDATHKNRWVGLGWAHFL
jgi:hypothetical protein